MIFLFVGTAANILVTILCYPAEGAFGTPWWTHAVIAALSLGWIIGIYDERKTRVELEGRKAA